VQEVTENDIKTLTQEMKELKKIYSNYPKVKEIFDPEELLFSNILEKLKSLHSDLIEIIDDHIVNSSFILLQYNLEICKKL
jgi:septation ring formation regulator EzrA